MANGKTIDDFISTSEAAEILKLTPNMICKLARAGEIVGGKKIGRDWIFPRSAVLAYTPRGAGWPKGKPRKLTAKEEREQFLRELNNIV